MTTNTQTGFLKSKHSATAAYDAFIKASAIPMNLIVQCNIDSKNYEMRFNRSTSKNGIHYRAIINTIPYFTFWYSRLNNNKSKFTAADCSPELKACLTQAIDQNELNNS